MFIGPNYSEDPLLLRPSVPSTSLVIHFNMARTGYNAYITIAHIFHLEPSRFHL